jgi:hypothetical protein
VGTPLYFTSFDTNSRISVIHESLGRAGLLDDNIVVSFIGAPNAPSGTNVFNNSLPVPFTTNSGIWTARIVVNEAGAPPQIAFATTNIFPVVQVGDDIPLDTGVRTVSSFGVYDALAPRSPAPVLGEHQLAFWVSSGAEQFIFKATLCPCLESPALAPPAPQNIVANDWRFTVEVSDDDGLVLTNVKLRDRFMARRVSLPYCEINTTSTSGRFELMPNSGAATKRSRLVRLTQGVRSDLANQPYSIAATYMVDRIGQDSCLQVIQEYLFYPLIADDCVEPSGEVEGQRFRPWVRYRFCGHDGEKLNSFTAAQRLHFQVDGVVTNNSGFFKDIDFEFDPPDIVTAEFRNQNPLELEGRVAGLVNGSAGDWDNMHQTWNRAVDEPIFGTLRFFGCPECAHIHWRWTDVPGFLSNFGFCTGTPFDGKPLIPRKELGYGYESDQSLDVALVKYSASEEDPTDFGTLINGEMLNGQDQVFWYIGSGKLPTDEFFIHDVFFAPVMPVTVRIERDLFGYVIKVVGPPGRTYTLEAKLLDSPTFLTDPWVPRTTFVSTGRVTTIPISTGGLQTSAYRVTSPAPP